MSEPTTERPVSIWQILAYVAWLEATDKRILQICHSDAALILRCDGKALILQSNSEDPEVRKECNQALEDAWEGVKSGPMRRRMQGVVDQLIENEGGLDAIVEKAIREQVTDSAWPRKSERPKA